MAESSATGELSQPGHYGVPGSGVAFAEATIAAAWNVQGDSTRAPFMEAVGRLFGIDLPTVPSTIATSDTITALWLGPRSWLLVAGGESPLVDFNAKGSALSAVGGALFDVSASRVAWTVSGPRATAVLAKGCPLDFHPRAFVAGTCAQSLLGHVGALFVKHDDAPTFTVMVARSYRHDAWRSLLDTAAQYGTEVRPPMPYRGSTSANL